ncbi:MAG: WG repeat-containing protein [Bacteroidota bacterium]
MNIKNIITIIGIILLVGLLGLMFTQSVKHKRISSTINTALNADQYTTTRNDTIIEKIYGKFRPHTVLVRIEKKWGIKDTITNALIVPAKYDYISSFANEGMIGFEQQKMHGFLNKSGKEICPAIYNSVTEFNNGLAAVRVGDKWGYIDTSGKVIIAVEFDLAWEFKNNYGAVLKNNKWGFINKKGQYVIQPIYDQVSRDFDNKTKVANVSIANHHFFIDLKGRIIKDSKPYDEYKP